ncbi:MAG: cellulase family glycosylhydrolase [Terracidiphilus sp.]
MQDGNRFEAPMNPQRRAVLKSMAAMAAASACSTTLSAMTAPLDSKESINPKWYGFNLLEYFSTDPNQMKSYLYQCDGAFKKDDFRWMRDWGFNWVRVPMDYRFWTDPRDLMKIDEKKIEPIDRVIRLGEKHGIHVNICLHRAPGYCCFDDGSETDTDPITHITRKRPNLFRDQATLDAFVNQWVFFAGRYAGISSRKLSFNLVNEPSDRIAWHPLPGGEKEYARVARAAIAGIRGKDPHRLIVTDGYDGPGWGHAPLPELFDTGILQSCHDYWPLQITHYFPPKANTPESDRLPPPKWPLQDAQGKVITDKRSMEEEFSPWRELAAHGVPIHIGEMGCHRGTPAAVVYAWLNDTLDMIVSMNAGWGLWNLRGPYGILDTDRAGTEYRDWHGHQLDFTLLRLLQEKMKA